MTAGAQTSIDLETFELPGLRDTTRWLVRRRICYWLTELEYDGRVVSTTTIGHRPEPGDAHLNKIERRYFHEPEPV